MEWRLFCAFELAADLRAQLEDHIRRLREAVPHARASWSRPENSHLTVKFFGNVAVEKLQQIKNAAERTAKEFAPIAIEVSQAGVFPNVNRARVLWIGVADLSVQLAKLQKRFEEECAAAGFVKEDRAYRPHLTIARIRTPEGARHLAEVHLQTLFEPMQITLSELIVFRSELSSKASKYTPLSQHRLSLSSA